MTISKNKVLRVLVLIAIGVWVSLTLMKFKEAEPTPSIEVKPATPLNVDNGYPLSVLTKEERLESINAFIKPYSFNLYHGTAVKRDYSNQEKKECKAAVEQLKKITSENILEPVYVAQSVNEDWVKKLLSGCGDKLEPEKDYIPSKEVWLDETHEHHDYSYYFQMMANMEFYDLSFALGDGYWGAFAEGGRPHCKNPQKNKDCESMVGFSNSSKIFNTQECQQNLNLGISSNRLLAWGKSTPEGRVTDYYPAYGFFAFVTLKEDLYQIAFKTDKRPDRACPSDWKSCPMTEKGTYLYLTKIPEFSSPNDTAVFCTFRPNLP